MHTPQSVYTPWSFGHNTIRLHALCWSSVPSTQTTAPVAVCVHGLTRNAWDFQDMADVLVTQGYTVWSLDIVGRGGSDPLPDASGYMMPTYVAQVSCQLTQLGVTQIDLWVGTSMGGIIGMLLAATGALVSRMVFNDVGAMLPTSALRRIAQTLRTNHFSSLEAAQVYFKERYAAFDIPEHRWSFMFEHGIIPDINGGYQLAYDPHIADNVVLAAGDEDIPLWSIWSEITCPVLLLKAEYSDFVTPEIITGMQVDHPNLTVVELAGCGHAPSLMQPDHLKPLLNWL